jgi:hypothetical protein
MSRSRVGEAVDSTLPLTPSETVSSHGPALHRPRFRRLIRSGDPPGSSVSCPCVDWLTLRTGESGHGVGAVATPPLPEDVPGRLTWLVHSMLVGTIGAVIYVYGVRSGWFFFDEWNFIANRAAVGIGSQGLWEPHNEHLSVIPVLVYAVLVRLVGLSTYGPYLALVVGLHLLAAHFLFRILLATGATRLLSLALSTAFMLVGLPASQTYLWAFQIGYVGSVALSLLAILVLVRRHTIPHGSVVLLAGLLVLSSLFSGVALLLVPAIILVAAVAHGWRIAAFVALPAVAFYSAWFVIWRPGSRSLALTPLPAFVWRGMGDAIGAFTGIQAAWTLGFAVTLLAIWLIGADERATAITAAMALGAIPFLLGVGVGRADAGVEKAGSGRYVYVVVALLLPLMGWGLGRLMRSTWSAVALGAVIAMVVVSNLGALSAVGSQLHERMARSRDAILAGAALLETDLEIVGHRPEPEWAPDLTVVSLKAMVANGWLDTPEWSQLGEEDQAVAMANLQMQLIEGVAQGLNRRMCGFGLHELGEQRLLEFSRPSMVLFASGAAGVARVGLGQTAQALYIRQFDLQDGLEYTLQISADRGVASFELPSGRVALLCSEPYGSQGWRGIQAV